MHVMYLRKIMSKIKSNDPFKNIVSNKTSGAITKSNVTIILINNNTPITPVFDIIYSVLFKKQSFSFLIATDFS